MSVSKHVSRNHLQFCVMSQPHFPSSCLIVCIYIYIYIFKPPSFPMAQQPLVGHGLLVIEASQSHSDTPHSVGLLWTSDQPDVETST